MGFDSHFLEESIVLENGRFMKQGSVTHIDSAKANIQYYFGVSLIKMQ
jgi:hypothetical protein